MTSRLGNAEAAAESSSSNIQSSQTKQIELERKVQSYHVQLEKVQEELKQAKIKYYLIYLFLFVVLFNNLHFSISFTGTAIIELKNLNFHLCMCYFRANNSEKDAEEARGAFSVTQTKFRDIQEKYKLQEEQVYSITLIISCIKCDLFSH